MLPNILGNLVEVAKSPSVVTGDITQSMYIQYNRCVIEPPITTNDFLFPHRSSSDAARVGRYLVLNIILNAILHILLWIVLTFYCWECTKLLSLEKLTVCFPTAIALWIVALVMTAIAWRAAIR